MTLKTCTKCGDEKPSTEFYRDGDRLRSDCKICNRARSNTRHSKIKVERNRRLNEQRLEHPERFQTYSRIYYMRHRDERIEAARKYRNENRAKAREREVAYRTLNREVILASRNNRRARLSQAEGKLTKATVHEVLAKWDGKCAYCDAATAPHLDHKTPLARGGSNWADNLQVLCKGCNSRKHTKTHEEFLAILNRDLVA